MGEQVNLATRDASWYDHPDTRSPKVYHVVVSPPYAPACNTTGAFLDSNSEVRASNATLGMVCRRRACWSRFQAALSRSSAQAGSDGE